MNVIDVLPNWGELLRMLPEDWLAEADAPGACGSSVQIWIDIRVGTKTTEVLWDSGRFCLYNFNEEVVIGAGMPRMVTTDPKVAAEWLIERHRILIEDVHDLQ